MRVLARMVFFPPCQVVASVFCNPFVTSMSWIHLLLLDFLLAKEIYVDGTKKGVFTSHSILLCFCVGPLGLLSHLITRHFTTSSFSTLSKA